MTETKQAKKETENILGSEKSMSKGEEWLRVGQFPRTAKQYLLHLQDKMNGRE